ncbi:MAG: D-alanine--D-alanine ligase [Spirochaetes bacterium GWD1_27_9]|nr:MAG: D-alanine--D-alanine ligase [Spirochaetes bacterium GWB1_27_13]OHD23096.1 MAG: D-alanine--D-alanine ligase [Spirochaetes bacterium GWC1_27_15]OHD39908.1 MAG: D-alanine--D-alanine ligase [Spirochaetes bacterium GWD1_27_9]
MKQKIGVIFGGKSVEHEVSIITGLQVVENIDKSKYEAIPIYIDKDGNWYYGENLKDVKIFTLWEKNKKKAKQFFPSFDKKDGKNILNKIDALVIAMHGNYGEDGKLQGLLEFVDVPYTSSGVVGSGAGMDKIVMKSIFEGMDLPVLPYLWFNRDDWTKNQKELINKIHYTLNYPIFVKPANLGSSIGISMAKNEEELINAIEIAISYDKRILVERGVEKAVEVNCSALCKDGEILVSTMEEPVKWEKFLSFEDKYIKSNSKSKGGMSSMSRKIPAEISNEIKSHIEKYTKEIYRTMDCKGVVRIDYILDDDRTKVYVNEINTIPGSLSFYLWEPSGIKFADLIDILIKEAITTNKDKERNIVRYDSELLKKLGGAKGSKR